MKKSLIIVAFIIVLSTLVLVGCGEIEVEPTVTDLPTVVPITLTPVPTVTSEPTATLVPTALPTPTLEPTVAPMREFLNDSERVAAVYPESVEFIWAENTSFFPNSALGISFDLPVDYALEFKSEPAAGAWEIIGGGMNDGRLLSLSSG